MYNKGPKQTKNKYVQWLHTSYGELFVVFSIVNSVFYSQAFKPFQKRPCCLLVQQTGPVLKSSPLTVYRDMVGIRLRAQRRGQKQSGAVQ